MTNSGTFRVKEKRSFVPPKRLFPQSRFSDFKINYQHSDLQPNPLRVRYYQGVFEKMCQHALGDLHNERFGILIGRVFEDPSTQMYWVEITDMLPAQRVRASIAHVEVSPEELINLDRQIDEQNLGQDIRKIGWYHTHPGHGIFMSGTDRENQRVCYNASWQVAVVVDPRNKEFGIFSGYPPIPVRSANIEFVPETQLTSVLPDSATVSPVAQARIEQPVLPGRQSLPTSRRTIREDLFKSIWKFTFLIAGGLFLCLISFFLEPATLQNLILPKSNMEPAKVTVTLDAANTATTGFQAPQTVQSETLLPTFLLTSSPTSAPTNTSALSSFSTNTPVPTATSTPVPTATSTPVPTAAPSPSAPLEAIPTVIPTYTTIPTRAFITYVVVRNDTLATIGQRYGISTSDILAANPDIENPNLIRVGQILIIPTHSGVVPETP